MRETAISFRAVAEADDLARLETALRRLSADIGEHYATESATLARAVLGAQPAAHGLLALRGEETVGAVLYSPVFSTVRGAAGVYVSDLWISPAARGQGLGATLLGRVAQTGAARWGAAWLRLAAYPHSHAAWHFYAQLGFVPAEDQQELRLGAPKFATLIKRAG